MRAGLISSRTNAAPLGRGWRHLFGLSKKNSGQFFAIDARDGKVLWLGPPRQATNSAVVKANGLLFLLNDDGEMIVARASRERFDPIARYTVAETATWAQPAISGNRIFRQGREHVVAVDVPVTGSG